MEMFMLCGKILNSYRALIFGDINRDLDSQPEKDAFKSEVDQARIIQARAYPIDSRVIPDYSGALQKFAYIRNDLTLQVNLVMNVIDSTRSEVLLNLLTGATSENINVLALGGGPGTEFLALLKYVRVTGPNPVLHYLCVDLEDWEPVWSAHVRPALMAAPDPNPHLRHLMAIENELRNVNFKVGNICDAGAYDAEMDQRARQADLFTIVYLVSEIIKREVAEQEIARLFFGSLMRAAKPGAIFLFADVGDSGFVVRTWFDEVVSASGVVKMLADGGDQNLKFQLDWLQNTARRGLGDHYSEMFNPRGCAQYCVRILQKEPTTITAYVEPGIVAEGGGDPVEVEIVSEAVDVMA